jgi:hypothetical protein
MINKTTRKNQGIIAVTILLLLAFCQTGLAEQSIVSVSPQEITASPGDTITVDIVVDPKGSEIFGAEYQLQFDSSILKATEQNGGIFLSQDGVDTIEITNNINNTRGTIEYGETRIGDAQEIGSITSSGVLASVSFEIIGSGVSDLKLDVMLADPGAQMIDAVVNKGICSIEGAGGPVTVDRTSKEQTSEQNNLPGFGFILSIIGLTAVSLYLKK